MQQKAATPFEPDHAAVAILAYRFWEERGRPCGSPEVDWLRAQHRLRSGDATPTLSLFSICLDKRTR